MAKHQASCIWRKNFNQNGRKCNREERMKQDRWHVAVQNDTKPSQCWIKEFCVVFVISAPGKRGFVSLYFNQKEHKDYLWPLQYTMDKPGNHDNVLGQQQDNAVSQMTRVHSTLCSTCLRHMETSVYWKTFSVSNTISKIFWAYRYMTPQSATTVPGRQASVTMSAWKWRTHCKTLPLTLTYLAYSCSSKGKLCTVRSSRAWKVPSLIHLLVGYLLGKRETF